MAKFLAQNFNALMLDMAAIEELPEAVVDEMLKTSADIGLEAMQKSLKSLGLVDTGQLIDSLTAVKKKGKDGKLHYLVYPSGSRRDTYTGGKLRRVSIKGHRKSGAAIKMSNNDVGFVLEFGAPKRNKKAYQWLRLALEQSAEAISAAQMRIYDKWLKSKNL